MVRVRIDVDEGLRRALWEYRVEVDEILDVVGREADAAGVPPEHFYPSDVAAEAEALTTAERALDIFVREEPETSLMGMDVPEDVLRALVTALELKRDDFERRATQLEADPLAPNQAALPLRSRAPACSLSLRTAN
jgi:hypothetical protein